ncbi:MAG: hypothetical protein L0K34_08100 [Ancrocorticia sp.]|nr:hypothetical protein [Ancrocorticia sp.]
MNTSTRNVRRAQAELQSARAELASIGAAASASRTERAAFRVSAAEAAMERLGHQMDHAA